MMSPMTPPMTPKGFYFSALCAGIKKKKRKDIGLIVSNPPSAAAALFTTNRIKAAPVIISQKHVKAAKKHAAIVCNSGCANAATGERGFSDAIKTAQLVATELECDPHEVLVASTGVIGEFLPMEKIKAAVPKLTASLRADPDGYARAIMTTDTRPKTAYRHIIIKGKKVTVWGCAKGAGMIHPDMATMLAFLLTDAAVSKNLLKTALKDASAKTFNTITIDGDTSTNDAVLLLANGAAGNGQLKKSSKEFAAFCKALTEICASLAEQIVADGEGATTIAEIKVEKAKNEKEAVAVARAISGSLLVKTALNGRDPNWGRIICAAGYSGVPVDENKMELYFGKHPAFIKGAPAKTPEKKLAAEMKKEKVEITLVLNRGRASASCLFCDISKDYVSINADYRS